MFKKSILIFSVILFCFNTQAQKQKFHPAMLQNPTDYASTFDKSFTYNEIKKFDNTIKPNRIILENGYVQSKFKNPQDWSQRQDDIVITQIDIVFTKYPKEKELWQTNYYVLLASRLKELFALDSTLNSNLFEWNLVLQTDCSNEEQAKKMFHGIVIYFTDVKSLMVEENFDPNKKTDYDTTYLLDKSLKVTHFIESQGGFGDSVVFKIFDRHPEWENTLVVMDWTGSMTPYAAQAVLWHSLNFKKSGMKYFVFFNDGDNKPDWEKKIGSTGGIYFSEANNLDKLINTFYLVSRNGSGGDYPENDIEAILKAIEKYPDFEEIVLIADNTSCIRDFSLLKKIDVSVNVVLCGTQKGINPQYVNLAYATGGTIHTIEEDISNLAGQLKDEKIILEGIEYHRTAQDILQCMNSDICKLFTDCSLYEANFSTLGIDELQLYLNQEGGITDSTVIQVLSRHPLWQNALVIMEWTPDMHTNSAQAVLWQKQNLKTSGIRYYSFFNDGDKKTAKEKKPGNTGGIYFTKANNIRRVVKRFYYVQKKGAEIASGAANSVEAIVRSVAQYRKAENVILIVNNHSCVRDLKLLQYVNIPVKVLVTNVSDAVNPQYVNIAYKTGGSLHTIQEDVYEYVFKSVVKEGKFMIINGHQYDLDRKGMFQLHDKSLARTSFPCKF